MKGIGYTYKNKINTRNTQQLTVNIFWQEYALKKEDDTTNREVVECHKVKIIKNKYSSTINNKGYTPVQELI